MYKVYKEEIESSFVGCVIDFETTGPFRRGFQGDSREYMDITPVIFGYLSNNELVIACRSNNEDVILLDDYISSLISNLDRPFYAFQTQFESSILFYHIGQKIDFKELNSDKYERKEAVVRNLGIKQYGDPFNGDGRKCMEAWESGDYEDAIAHNRACLLKERDILLKRGYRESADIEYVLKPTESQMGV